MRFTRIVLLTTILLLTLGLATGAASEPSISLEYQVKAEFLILTRNAKETQGGRINAGAGTEERAFGEMMKG